MDKIVVKTIDGFRTHKDYYYIPETSEVYFQRFNRMLNKITSHGIQYYRIHKINYNSIKVKEWYDEWVNEGRPELIEIETETKLCRKCNITKKLSLFMDRKTQYCNECFLELRDADFDDDFLEVDRILKILKAKNWMATIQDIFRIIDAYDRYYPEALIARPITDESGNQILLKIIKKHEAKKRQYLI
jgi:hypothetical protein